MARLRTMVSNRLPGALRPYGRRAMRRIDQIRGYPTSGQRPGAVLMLHVGRCGSTVLANLLSQHPNIYWDGKLPRLAKTLYGDGVKNLDIVDWTRRQFLISGSRYYGFEFKILADQYPAILGTTAQDFLAQSRSMGVTHYILLVRRNTLRHVVSHYASINRGMWHSSNTASARNQKFALDVQSVTTGSSPGRPLVQYLQEVEDAHLEVREQIGEQNLLEIEYETDINEKGAGFAYEKVCDFLSLESARAEVSNKRLNPYPMSDTILNFDEVAAELRGTKFEWMLEGDTGHFGGS